MHPNVLQYIRCGPAWCGTHGPMGPMSIAPAYVEPMTPTCPLTRPQPHNPPVPAGSAPHHGPGPSIL